MSDVWIEAEKALAMVSDSYGNRTGAAMAIYNYAKEGKIESKAEKIIVWTKYGNRPSENTPIPSVFWEYIIRSSLAEELYGHKSALRWSDWKIGYFSVSIDGTPYEVQGVAFARVGIEALLKSPLTTSTTTATTKPTVKAESDCLGWLEEQFSSDLQKVRVKDDFKTAAMIQFPNLSGRGFFRAWAAVAPRFERDLPGVKSKQPSESNH